MKLRLLLMVLMLTAAFSYGRSQSFFALQAEVAEPTEGFRDAAGTGRGVSATYMHYISPYVALTGSTGYVKWTSRSNLPPDNEYKFVSVPVAIGCNLLLSRGAIAPFVGINFGMDYLRIRGIADGSTVYSDASELRFTLFPEIGVGAHIAGPVGLLASGSYNVIYTAGTPTKFFALDVGLAVGF